MNTEKRKALYALSCSQSSQAVFQGFEVERILYKQVCTVSVLSLAGLASSAAIAPLSAQPVDSLQDSQTTLTQLPLLSAPPEIRPSPRPTPPEPQLPPRLPPPEELLKPPTVPVPAPEATPGAIPETIVVKQFKVTGSTVFSPAALDKVTQPFTARPISLAELFQVRSAITQLYVARGYITSGAYIPPQTLQAGMVEIRVIEGELEAIQVSGTRRLNPRYIRRRLEIATYKPLNQKRLLSALQLLQLNPLIEQLSAELSAGSRPGSNLLEVRVAEARTFKPQIVLDNGRSPSIGSFQRRLQLSEANLLGQGDGISAAYTNTDGSNGVDFSYSLPVNARNGTVSVAYGTTFSNIVEPPFNELDINATSRYYELTFRQPLLQSPQHEFAIGFTAARSAAKASLFDGEIPYPTLGADEEGQTRVSALRFFQEWTRRSPRQVVAMRSQLSFGLGILDSTINSRLPDSRFVSWRGQGQWVRRLAPETLVLVRGDLQIADRDLLALEQFGLGGLSSVRGYRQDFLLTDNGAFASAEVRVPIWRFERVRGVLQIAPFVDLGTGWNYSLRPNPDPTFLASVGLGLRWQWRDRLTARFDWGVPLVSVESQRRTLQENGFYFSLVYSP